MMQNPSIWIIGTWKQPLKPVITTSLESGSPNLVEAGMLMLLTTLSSEPDMQISRIRLSSEQFNPPELGGFFAPTAAVTPGEPHKSETSPALSPVFTT
jgi:hypothetical protein